MKAKSQLRNSLFTGILLLAAAAVTVAAPPTITQQVTPGTFSYQGRVQDAGGGNYSNGIYTLEFRVYDDETAGTLLWAVSYKPYLNNGYFSVILGQTGVGEVALSEGQTYSAAADLWKALWIDPSLGNTARYLSITVKQKDGVDIPGAQPSFPRQQFLTAPFALQAQFAQTAREAEYAHNASGDFMTPSGVVKVTSGTTEPSEFPYANIQQLGAGSIRLTNDLVITTGTMTSFGNAPLKFNNGNIYNLGANTLHVTNAIHVQGQVHAAGTIGSAEYLNGNSLWITNEARVVGKTTTGNGGSVEVLRAKGNTWVEGKINLQGDLDMGGDFLMDGIKPFVLEKHVGTVSGNDITIFNTPTYDVATYTAMIVGFFFFNADIAESGTGYGPTAILRKDGGSWQVWVGGRFQTNIDWDFEVHVLYIRNELTQDTRAL